MQAPSVSALLYHLHAVDGLGTIVAAAATTVPHDAAIDPLTLQFERRRNRIGHSTDGSVLFDDEVATPKRFCL